MTTDSTELFEQFRRTGRRSIRNQLVEQHMGLAIHIARSFDSSSRRDADVEQVAMLGLVKAVDRFDPSLGVPFAAFAGRTIEGEVKRYFRDATWSLKVPRGAKDLHLAVRRGVDQLATQLARSPTPDEVAEFLQISRDDVITGLVAGEARSIASIEPKTDADNGTGRSIPLATTDRGFGDIDDQSAIADLLATLPDREREIVELRFFEELSQAEIAERIGISQMHVSRLLRVTLDRLRGRLVEQPDGIDRDDNPG